MFELLLGLSYHAGLEGNYNEVHPHARYTYESVIGGAYYNSESSTSFYFGLEKPITDNVNIEFGGVTGYSTGDILPFMRVVYEEEHYNLFAAPAFETYNGKDKMGFVIGIEIPITRTNNNGTRRKMPSDGKGG